MNSTLCVHVNSTLPDTAKYFKSIALWIRLINKFFKVAWGLWRFPMALHEFYWRNEAWLIEDVVNKRHLSEKKYLLILEFTVSAYHLHIIFGWDFWDKWNSLFLPVKTGQYKNDPVELGRLERLVPGLQSRRPCVREWHEWDFCKWYSLSRSFRLKRKKRNTFEGIPSIPENFHRVEPFHLTFHPDKPVFRYNW